MKINWSGPLTKGRIAYAKTRSLDSFQGINYDSGFFVGWDKWSDGKPDLCFLRSPWNATALDQ